MQFALCVFSRQNFWRAVGLCATLGFAAPAAAQSFDETVNFVFTGDTSGKVTFGNEMVNYTASIKKADASTCTVEFEMVVGGITAPMLAMTTFPDLDMTSDRLPAEIVLGTTVALDNVSNWSIRQKAPDGRGSPTNEAILNGVSAPVSSTTMSAEGATPMTAECTSHCVIPLSPAVDPNRWVKAMDYLYAEYCTGIHSAF